MAFTLRLHSGFQAQRRRDRNDRGNAAVEFALIGPILVLMLLGIFTYGGYFLTAHTIQQIANDAARAAIAGLDDDERTVLVRESIQSSLAQQDYLRGDIENLQVATANGSLSVRLTYDASEDMYWAFESLLPVPSPRISRAAVIRLGGM